MRLGIWDLPRPEIEPMPLALQGGFLTTGLPGKPKPHISSLAGKWKYSRRECKACGIAYGKLRHTWDYALQFLPGESHGQRAWRAIVHGVIKSRTRLKRLSTAQHTALIDKWFAVFGAEPTKPTLETRETIHPVPYLEDGRTSHPLPLGSCRCASVAL